MKQADQIILLRRVHKEFSKLGIDPNSRIVEITPEGGVKVTPCDSTRAAIDSHRDPSEVRLDAVQAKLKTKAIAREAPRRA